MSDIEGGTTQPKGLAEPGLIEHFRNTIKETQGIALKHREGFVRRRLGEEYCRFCGEDVETAHQPNCPHISGWKTRRGYVSWGIKEFEHPEENKKLAAWNQLLQTGGNPPGIVIEVPVENAERLILEFVIDNCAKVRRFEENGGSGIIDRMMWWKPNKSERALYHMKNWLDCWKPYVENSKYLDEGYRIIEETKNKIGLN